MNLFRIPPRNQTVFILLDTSGSSEDSRKIQELNMAMREILEPLMQKTTANIGIQVAVLEFNSGARWVTAHGPEDLEEDVIWEDLKAVPGPASLGPALEELNRKLSNESGWLGKYPLFPCVFLISDGRFCDDYLPVLQQLRENKYFCSAFKAAVAVGEMTNEPSLADFTGNKEAILPGWQARDIFRAFPYYFDELDDCNDIVYKPVEESFNPEDIDWSDWDDEDFH